MQSQKRRQALLNKVLILCTCLALAWVCFRQMEVTPDYTALRMKYGRIQSGMERSQVLAIMKAPADMIEAEHGPGTLRMEVWTKGTISVVVFFHSNGRMYHKMFHSDVDDVMYRFVAELGLKLPP